VTNKLGRVWIGRLFRPILNALICQTRARLQASSVILDRTPDCPTRGSAGGQDCAGQAWVWGYARSRPPIRSDVSARSDKRAKTRAVYDAGEDAANGASESASGRWYGFAPAISAVHSSSARPGILRLAANLCFSILATSNRDRRSTHLLLPAPASTAAGKEALSGSSAVHHDG
jgi:hypothetical protein